MTQLERLVRGLVHFAPFVSRGRYESAGDQTVCGLPTRRPSNVEPRAWKAPVWSILLEEVTCPACLSKEYP